MGSVTQGRPGELLGRLTRRESDVLAAMADGKTNAAIAESLFLSRRAVEKHINSIFSKLSLTGDEERHARVHAVLIHLTSASSAGSGTPVKVVSDTADRWPSGPRHVDRVHLQHARANRRRNGLGHRLPVRPLAGDRPGAATR